AFALLSSILRRYLEFSNHASTTRRELTHLTWRHTLEATRTLCGRRKFMPIERTVHPYIVRDSSIYEGEPVIEGTRTGVRHVILLFQAGKDPEEIAAIHRLSLAQVYDAISYFYDNEAEITHYIRHDS